MGRKRGRRINKPAMEGFGLLDKRKEAIEYIRKHAPKEEDYFLAFSGGKDSVVLLDLAKKAGVGFQAYYSFTGIDPPELAKFVRNECPEVKWLRPEKSFFAQMQYAGFPTRKSRWCCDFLKKKPAAKIPLEHRLIGVRAEESFKRAKRPRRDYNKALKQWLVKPIFYWLEWEIWEYIDENKLPYCSLYDEGFSRLGCVVCPFICSPDKKLLDKHRKRWPPHYRAFEKAMRRLFKRRKAEGKWAEYGNVEDMIEAWYRGDRVKVPVVEEEGFGLLHYTK